jgi:uncharacterized protein (TIGR02757 family)
MALAHTITDTKLSELKKIFDGLYEKYNHHELIKPDPLQFVYEYANPADMEIAGFLAASLAYGRVEQIENSVRNLLGRLGKNPYEFVVNFQNRDRVKFAGFKHRFNTGDDIADLILLFQKVITESGSIEKYFVKFYDEGDENIIPALSGFCETLLNLKSGGVSQGLKFLLAGPNLGGVAKRLNMFLRWMVRGDDVDAGLWRAIDKSKLIMPVDVHIGRLTRILGFHKNKNITLKTAVEITRRFAEIEPADPVKYDFALSRIGIVENCTGHSRSGCEFCELFRFCSHG